MRWGATLTFALTFSSTCFRHAGRGAIDALFIVLLFFPAMYVFTRATFDYALVSPRGASAFPTSPMMPIIYPLKAAMPITRLLLLIRGVSELLKSYYGIASNRRFRETETEHLVA